MLGQMNNRIEILTESGMPDGAGGFVSEYKVFAEVWGKVSELSAQRAFALEQIRDEAVFEIVVRTPDDFKDVQKWSALRVIETNDTLTVHSKRLERQEKSRYVRIVAYRKRPDNKEGYER